MELIDKSVIVEEIKGYISNYKKIVAKTNRNDSTWVDSVSMIDAKIDVLQHVLFFLDTLEVKKVDLKKEFDNYAKNILACDVQFEPFTHLYNCAKYFYELGLRAKDVNEIIKTAEDHAYFAGSENAREKLIDKACVWLMSHINDYLVKGRDIDYMFDDFRKAMEDE